MTFAQRRTGPMARSGTPNVFQPRGRCPFFDTLALGTYVEGRDFIQRLQRGLDIGTLTVELERIAETPDPR